MCAGKMHDDEVRHRRGSRAPVAHRAVPAMGGPADRAVRSTGTVNAIYRLGDDLSVRLPRVEEWARTWTRSGAGCRSSLHVCLCGSLSLGRATLRARTLSPGRSTGGSKASPIRMNSSTMNIRRPRSCAVRRRVAPSRSCRRAPPGGRKPLRQLDAVTRAGDRVSAGRHRQRCGHRRLGARTRWTGVEWRAVWIHADLLRPNVLVHGGRLCAVIDFGGVGVGDPAADVIAAWSVFGHTGRRYFVMPSTSTTARGIGHAASRFTRRP